MTMDDAMYQATQNAIMGVAQVLAILPIEEFLKRIDTCESVAPVLDPTLYKRGIASLEHIKGVAKAALQVKRALRGE